LYPKRKVRPKSSKTNNIDAYQLKDNLQFPKLRYAAFNPFKVSDERHVAKKDSGVEI